MFLDVIHELDEHLKQHVFGRMSGLTAEAVARPLLEAGLGHIGHAAKLLEVAALKTIDGVLAGTCPKLTLEHIADAFARSPLRRQNPDLFGRSSPGAGEHGHNPMTRLRGRTHRTNRDAAFKG